MKSKNLQKVSDMLNDTFSGYKPQVGYTPKNVVRKVGDIWIDNDGVKWEQKKGYRMKVSKLANVGIFKYQCKDCGRGCTKSFDVDTYKRMQRCMYCQINFESDLKTKGIWHYWVRLQQLNAMESIEKDMEQLIINNDKEDEKNPFDETVANALAGENVDNTIKMHKNKM